MARQEPQNPTEPRPPTAPDRATFLHETKERLAKTEEFQERADGWMKEVTSQVARLATGAEKEEKRRETLEKRLADIEERIRSLLTLTEMISLDKNPFASTPTQAATKSAPSEPENTRAAPEPAPEPVPEPSPPEPEPAQTAPVDPFAVPSQDNSEEEGEPTPPQLPPNGVEVIPVGPETQPTESKDPAPPTPEKRNTKAYHPNDAAKEAQPPAPLPETSPAPPASASDPVADPVSQRLFVIAWADLLAPAANQVDLESFTQFYVESGWVDPQSARLVKPLARSMAPQNPPASIDLRRLHEQTVHLLAEHGTPEKTTAEEDAIDGHSPSLNAT